MSTLCGEVIRPARMPQRRLWTGNTVQHGLFRRHGAGVCQAT